MQSDLAIFLNWWATWFLLGIISWPATHILLGSKKIPFVSYACSKTVGLVTVGYGIWLGSSLHWFSFSNQTIIGAISLWVIINLYLLKKQYKEFAAPSIKNNILNAFRLETIFVLSLAFWSWIRTFQPKILDLEKFMDYGFVNTILRTQYFPPQDMWFAGGSINYYYFGHYLSAFMIKIANIPSSQGYNLMIATVFALCVLETFAIGSMLVSKVLSYHPYNAKYRRYLVLGGLLCAFLITWRGNLHWGAHALNQWLNGCGSQETVCTQSHEFLPDATKGYWYPDATRYIPYTIHEFPIYSFVVSDLHAHVINMPLVLVMIAILMGLLEFYAVWKVIPLGILLGIFYMSNAWDLPIYWLLTAITLVIYHKEKIFPGKDLLAIVTSIAIWGLLTIYWYLHLGQVDSFVQVMSQNRIFWVLGLIGTGLIGYLGITIKNSHIDRQAFIYSIKKIVLPLFVIGIIAILTSFPFTYSFEQIAQGVLPVNARSEFSKLIILWGWDLFLISSLIAIATRYKKNLLIWDYWALGLYGLGLFLIMIPEFIYVKDIYIQEYHRANTMFKLVYQSWILFGIAGTYTIARVILMTPQQMIPKIVRAAWIFLVMAMIVILGQYPLEAISAYYNLPSFRHGPKAVFMPITTPRQTLDGELWLKEKSPAEYNLLQKLKSLPGQPVILEATGDSYTEFNRFSAYSGLPTVEGWLVHEWLWRGGYDRPGIRAEDVEHIYTALDFNTAKIRGNGQSMPTAKALIQQYQLQYIIIGDKEREKYQERLFERKFESWPIVFEEGNSRIYQIPKNI